MSVKLKAATYVRISMDKARDEHGVVNQDDETARFCASRGLEITARYCDNDISASNGKHRPDYEAMMAAAARREFGSIVVFQTSRLWRNRIERAHAIEILRHAGVSVLAVKGPSLDMSTAYGRGMAGLLGEFDTMEGEVKSERQKLANAASAKAGKRPPAAHRPFGYQPGGIHADPAEAGAIRWAADCLLGGGTISAVMREWQRRGLVTAQTGRPFTRQSITTILRNPRIAGLATLPRAKGEQFGEEVGRGEWEAVLSEETWRAVKQLLDDPGRKPPKGVRTLLGGLARCACGNTITGTHNHRGDAVYRCVPATRGGRPGPHATVRAALIDTEVETRIVGYLSQPALADVVDPPRHTDTGALHRRAETIRSSLNEMAADRVAGLVSRAQLIAATERANAELQAIAAQLADAAGGGPLAAFTGGAERAAAVWDGLDLSRRRAVIAAATEAVTLHPAGRGARNPDLSKVVRVSWAAE